MCTPTYITVEARNMNDALVKVDDCFGHTHLVELVEASLK